MKKMKLNSVEWWKAVGEACQKDEAYVGYVKAAANPMTFKLKVDITGDKPIMATFENGKLVDVHEALPGEEAKLGISGCSHERFVQMVNGQIGMVYAFTHKMLVIDGLVTLMQFGRPFIQMFENVAKTVSCES